MMTKKTLNNQMQQEPETPLEQCGSSMVMQKFIQTMIITMT